MKGHKSPKGHTEKSKRVPIYLYVTSNATTNKNFENLSLSATYGHIASEFIHM